jgi:FKBP-type peptidyl-prolyl cis-trans isomerase SlyD
LRGKLLLVCFSTWILSSVSVATAEEEAAAVVAEGGKIVIEYTLKLDDGTVVDTTEGGDPLGYRHGNGQMFPALEAALVGMKVGETRSVTLPPEQGYGVVDPELIEEVPVESMPEESRVVGAQIIARDKRGTRRPVRVREIRDDVIVLDLNHPLAGEALHFEVRVVAIE